MARRRTALLSIIEEGFPAVPNRADVFTIGNGHDVDFSIIDEAFVDYNCPMSASGGVLIDLDLKVPTSEFSQMREYDGFVLNCYNYLKDNLL